ncbi:hypothetical protein [Subtercola lobariae]|uniref:Uncharacterized protein n=1 Tax=Subtercola lobariae TaxID=1588641 RepID=A0A917EX91_9MICO|nr:hypothetical protein [Subtercola lobariae]GGF18476.1 hypothetical protein GCM10011399_10170 [Subtercola lobariae]
MTEKDRLARVKSGAGTIGLVGTEAAAAAFVAGTLTNGIGLVLGAAAVPIVTASLEALVEGRSKSFQRKLEAHGLSPELIAEKVSQHPALADLVSATINEAIRTDSDAKRALLASILAGALLDDTSRELGFDRRVISCLQRVDAAEILILSLVAKSASTQGQLDEMRAGLGGVEPDVIDTVTAVLVSEGLVSGAIDGGFRLTGFGRRILSELNKPNV